MNLRKPLVYLSALFLFNTINCSKKDSPTEPPVNHPPVIERIVANPEKPYTEDRVRLECIVDDPDIENGDILYYDWRSSYEGFESFDEKVVFWNAPQTPGSYSISVKVEDKERESASRSINLNITSRFDTLYVIEDTYISERYPDLNMQNDPEEYKYLWIHYGRGDRMTEETYLKFNLNSLNPEKNIRSSNLRLTDRYPVEEGDEEEFPCYIYKVTGPWNEQTITWNNKPNYDRLPKIHFSLPPVPRTEDPYIFYVNTTDLIKDLMRNPSENYGFKIRPTEESDSSRWHDFYSKEGAQMENNINLAPALIVEYE